MVSILSLTENVVLTERCWLLVPAWLSRANSARRRSEYIVAVFIVSSVREIVKSMLLSQRASSVWRRGW